MKDSCRRVSRTAASKEKRLAIASSPAAQGPQVIPARAHSWKIRRPFATWRACETSSGEGIARAFSTLSTRHPSPLMSLSPAPSSTCAERGHLVRLRDEGLDRLQPFGEILDLVVPQEIPTDAPQTRALFRPGPLRAVRLGGFVLFRRVDENLV